MGGGGARAGSGPSGLQSENRLLFRHTGGELAERLRVENRFHIEEDLMHILFVFPEFNRARRVHVSLIADRNELGKTNAEVLQNIKDAAAKSAGLRNETDVAAAGQRLGKAPVHADCGVRIHDTEAVRTNHRHAVLMHALSQSLFERQTFRAGFLESGRNHDNAFDPSFVALIDRIQHVFRVDCDDGEIDSIGESGHARINFTALQDASLRIDQIKVALEAVIDQTMQQIMANCVITGRCTDKHDRLRVHYRRKIHSFTLLKKLGNIPTTRD